ncbi:MAG: DNA repair protein RecO [Clostridia bacterium]|nr:DNA repair protein RecO [Clostridia bacterium]
MEEIKTKAIVLKTTDYGEADKIASLFSLEYGKISAKFVGVKRAKAKLRYLIQPFSFIELECMKRQDFYMVKTGGVIDSFPNIISDYSKTICGYIVVDIIDKILLKNKVEKDIFLLTARALKAIENSNPYRATIDYIIIFFDLLGEALNLELTEKMFLDLNLGNFSANRSENCLEIDKKCYQNLSTDLKNENLNKMSLRLLHNIFKAKYDIELNSFSFL